MADFSQRIWSKRGPEKGSAAADAARPPGAAGGIAEAPIPFRTGTRYHLSAVLREEVTCRTMLVENDVQQRFLMYELSFNSDIPSAVRMRLEYETARLASLAVERMAIPVAFEFHETSGRIVCPLMSGRPLSEFIAAAELTIPDILQIADDILEVLRALHQHGLVRRCLRPEEVLIDGPSGQMRASIGGCGPLLLLQERQSAESAREIARYSSPEALGALDEDVRGSADLYSLGLLLFECLTGRPPFDGADVGQLVFHHLTSPVRELTSIKPDIPPDLSDMILRLLQKHPRDRYQSAVGVQFDIRQVRRLLQGGDVQCLVPGTMDCRETLIEPAFVGRADDLAVLQAALEAVRQGQSRQVLLTAASGLGKSRLMLEMSRMAVSRGFLVMRAQGQNQPALAPLSSLRGALQQCLELLRQEPELKARLQSELSEFARELRATVPELADELHLQVPVDRTDDLSDRRIAVALATFLGALGTPTRPVLIQLDDLQWADDLTLTMLECWHLTSPRQTLLMVGTRPTVLITERFQDHLQSATRMTLDPLSRTDLEQLLGSMAGGLPSQILSTVWEMSTGNPFVATAVMRGLVEGGVLTPSSAGWQVDETQLRNLQMSGEAAEVLKRRLFRLSPESQELLAVGAVMGKEFSIEMAADLAGIPRDRVLELLIEPRRNYLVWERATGSLCSFMHDQIREAVLGTLEPARRADIHLRAARFLQRCEPQRIFDIAFHYDAAGRSDLAGVFAMEAAERARASHALETAEQQYRIAMKSAAALHQEPPFSVLYGLGDVLMLSGHYQQAEPLFERAIRAADSTLYRAEVTLKLGELAFKEDRKDRAIELWESAMRSLGGWLPPAWLVPASVIREVLVQGLHSMWPGRFLGRIRHEPTEEERLVWRLHSRLAYAYWFVRSKLDVLHVHLRGMNLAERYRPTAELAQAWSEHAPAMSLIPLRRRGIAYGRRSLQIRTEQNDIWGQGQSLHFLAIALYSAAQFEECVDVGRRSVRILDRAGDFWEKHIAQYQVAASLYRLGRFTEAVQYAREAYDSGIAVGDYQVCGNIVEVWARATNGDVPEQILQCELNRPRSDVQGQAHVLLARGVQLMSEQLYQEAAQVFGQGIAAARSAGISNTYTSPLYAWQATALRGILEHKAPQTQRLRLKIVADHRRAARRALLVALRFRNELPHALREYAWAQILQNRNRRGLLLLKMSVQVARKQSAGYELIQSELLLQRVRREMGHPDAVAALEQAERRLSTFQSEQLPQQLYSSLSLVDRFDSLLESGRRIASAIDPVTIIETAVDSARRLLRSNYCLFMPVDLQGQPETQNELLRTHVLAALKAHDAVAASHTGSEFRSLMTCPVVVRGRSVACLVIGNSEVRNLFGMNELRIARYITTIAGAALENAEGFRDLKELNANLERMVADRTAAVEARSEELMLTADNLRRAQTQLAAARDAAESASQAKTRFLAHMSHEIRTPISAVLGFTELLLQGNAPLVPEQRAWLQRVLSNGRHLHLLLNDLLDLSRIEAGELTIESMDCSPAPLIQETMSALQAQAISRGLTLSLRIDDGIPERIRTDPTRLRQILTNLIGNAIKFTETGGVSLIVQTDPAHRRLAIRVQDTGPGIALAAQARVFEPFRQADETVARRFGGTGLGLSISRRLAQALGGDIDLVSEPGYGSTFTVTIDTGPLDGVRFLSPRDVAASSDICDVETPPGVRLNGHRILIADDIEANREFLTQVLQQAGAVCQVVCNGQEAVETLGSDRFDLVLMDMQMPIVDGYTATQRVRAGGVATPIVAITANGTDDDRQRCLRMGCTGFLTKPISIASLLRGVAEQLGLNAEPPADSGVDQPDDQSRFDAARHPGALPQRGDTTTIQARTITLPSDPFFRDIAIRFTDKVHSALPDLIRVVNQSDAAEVLRMAHWLKGTGGTVGLPGLTELGLALHAAAQSGNFDTARELTRELQTAVAALQAESQLQGGTHVLR